MSGIHHCEKHGFTTDETCPNCGKSVEQITSNDQKRSLSGFMSWALRHEPENAGIEVDNHGWTTIEELIDAAKDQHPFIDRLVVEGIAAVDDKGRYEIDDDKIRAVYAHSFPVTINSSSDNVPDTLLHGTATENAQSILEEGLKPMGREKVHLTPDEEEASNIGNRHSHDVTILEIDAKSLEESGQKIEERSDIIYTTDKVDPKYITVQ